MLSTSRSATVFVPMVSGRTVVCTWLAVTPVGAMASKGDVLLLLQGARAGADELGVQEPVAAVEEVDLDGRGDHIEGAQIAGEADKMAGVVLLVSVPKRTMQPAARIPVTARARTSRRFMLDSFRLTSGIDSSAVYFDYNARRRRKLTANPTFLRRNGKL